MHVNVRDLRVPDRMAHLELLIKSHRRTVDVLAVSETWFRNPDEAACYELNGFRHLACCRSVRLGGGVSVYIHNRWTILEHTSSSSSCDGVQVVKAILVQNQIFFTIVAFCSRALSCMETLLNELERELSLPFKGTLILFGDANIDLLTWRLHTLAFWPPMD